jgi:hypothetical protein
MKNQLAATDPCIGRQRSKTCKGETMISKTLSDIAPDNRSNGSTGNWTFGWTPNQASVLSASANAQNIKRGVSQSDRQAGVYGILATRSVNRR